MGNIFTKLLMARQIKFEEGEIDLMKQRVVIVPNDFLIELSFESDKSIDGIKQLYQSAKRGVKEGFAKELNKSFGLKGAEFIKWLIDISGLSGWGNHDLIRIDPEKKIGILKTMNAPVAMKLKGRVNNPTESIWRGLLAGGASAVFNEDIDFVETKCFALGDPYCEFVFKPRNILLTEGSELIKKQI